MQKREESASINCTDCRWMVWGRKLRSVVDFIACLKPMGRSLSLLLGLFHLSGCKMDKEHWTVLHRPRVLNEGGKIGDLQCAAVCASFCISTSQPLKNC